MTVQITDEERLRKIKEITANGRRMTLNNTEYYKVMELLPAELQSHAEYAIDCNTYWQWYLDKKLSEEMFVDFCKEAKERFEYRENRKREKL